MHNTIRSPMLCDQIISILSDREIVVFCGWTGPLPLPPFNSWLLLLLQYTQHSAGAGQLGLYLIIVLPIYPVEATITMI